MFGNIKASKVEIRKEQVIPDLRIKGGIRFADKSEIKADDLKWYKGEVLPVGSILRTPLRLLSGFDEYFKAVGYEQGIYKLAYRDTTRATKAGDNTFNTQMRDFINNPPEEAVKEASELAETLTFTNRPGKMAENMSNFVRDHPSLRAFVPFVRTPANIIGFAMDRSPAAVLFKSNQNKLRGLEGGAAFDENDG